MDFTTSDATSQKVGHKYAIYPPPPPNIEILGYVQDDQKPHDSRDIGCSSLLGGQVFYTFGDTFCKDYNGKFIGVVSHTCTSVPDKHCPTKTKYLAVDNDGRVDSFIPLTEAEKAFDADKRHKGRCILWSFSGIAEDHLGAGTGWCWFERGKCDNGPLPLPLGTGVAQVRLDEKSGNAIVLKRKDMFDVSEPRWGAFATLVENGYIYLWGHHGKDIMLGRVALTADPFERSAYTFWNGEDYMEDMQSAEPAFSDKQHGGIFRSNLFHPSKGKNYIFIGVGTCGDSKVIMGTAPRLEGPWEFLELFQATGLHYHKSFMYCINPHPWASDEERGELMVTWSEPWPGGVVAAKVSFQLVK